MAIHLKRHTYDAGEPFTLWVHTIARYKLIDYLRRTRTAASVPIDEATEVLAQDDHADAESSHDIRILLGRLPEKVRCPIECVKLEGRSVAEAAVRCGIRIRCQDQYPSRVTGTGDLYRAGDQR